MAGQHATRPLPLSWRMFMLSFIKEILHRQQRRVLWCPCPTSPSCWRERAWTLVKEKTKHFHTLNLSSTATYLPPTPVVPRPWTACTCQPVPLTHITFWFWGLQSPSWLPCLAVLHQAWGYYKAKALKGWNLSGPYIILGYGSIWPVSLLEFPKILVNLRCFSWNSVSHLL